MSHKPSILLRPIPYEELSIKALITELRQLGKAIRFLQGECNIAHRDNDVLYYTDCFFELAEAGRDFNQVDQLLRQRYVE